MVYRGTIILKVVYKYLFRNLKFESRYLPTKNNLERKAVLNDLTLFFIFFIIIIDWKHNLSKFYERKKSNL